MSEASTDHETPVRPAYERGKPLHVLEILGNAISGGMEMSVVRLVREWPRERFRVSALCPFESGITQALRDAGADVLIAPVRDDPPWDSVQLAASYAQDEDVHVLHAHLANAHVLAALVSALTDRPTLAAIHARAVPMLDLEAHRSSDRMHMSVACRAAYRHARAIGVARERLHFVAALGARARDEALDRWPEHETAMRVGALLATVATQAPPAPRTAPSASVPRMRLAARTADVPHDP